MSTNTSTNASTTMNSTVNIPRSLDEVTAAWLSQALGERFPGTEVISMTFGSEVRATGTKVRLLLDYNDAGHRHRLPATMWFKGGLEPHSDNIRTSHARETLFYDEIEPLNLINAPRGYFAGYQDGYAAQLIEDLLQRNARFGSALRPLSAEQTRQGLVMLANLHAHWWMSPELERLGPPGGSLATDGIVLRILEPEAWSSGLGRPAGALLPESLRDLPRVRQAMQAQWALDMKSDMRCLVHGDPHPGNLFFEQDGTPGFLDWQRTMQCDWAHDVNYFTVASMDADECAATERDLLESYLMRLEQLGVPRLDRELAWRDYRQHTAYGLVWNVVPPVMQTEAVCAAEAWRFNAAAARHDIEEALGLSG